METRRGRRYLSCRVALGRAGGAGMTAGMCQSCGGELGDGFLRFALEAGPGPRGGSSWSITGTRLDGFDVCAVCVSGEEAANTVLAKMLSDQYSRALRVEKRRNRCTIECMRPRYRSRILLTRRPISDFEHASCPVCFGPADVREAPDSRPVRVRLRDRLRGRMPLREPWPDPEKRTKGKELEATDGNVE